VFCFGVTYAEHRIAAAMGRYPLQVDLVRGFRYLLLFIPLFCLWPLARLGGQRFGTMALVGGALVAALWVALYGTPYRMAWDGLRCLALGPTAACATPQQQARRDLIVAAGDLTPAGGLLYADRSDDGLAVRHAARRPVTWLWKDGAILLYGNQTPLPRWQRVVHATEAINRVPDAATRIELHLTLARQLGADYALLRQPAAALPAGVSALFSNQAGILLKVEPAAP
jgi:hypothetical protein